MLISCLYIEYFLLLFTVLLLKLQYELLVGSKAVCQLSTVQQLHQSAERCRPSVTKRCLKQATGTKNTKNCGALYDFYGKMSSIQNGFLRGVTQVTMLLSNQIYNGSV